MKLAVIGGSGLVGRNICQVAHESGHQVRSVLRRSPTAQLPYEHTLAWLDDADSLRKAFAGADVVVHCAALYEYGATRQSEVMQTNVEGTRAVVGAAADARVRRVVVTSSSVTAGSSATACVRDETGTLGSEYVPPYFSSKARQEHVALETSAARDIEVVLGCPTVVLGGPVTRLVPSNAILLRYLLDPTRSTFPGGCNLVSVTDVARAHLLLAEHGQPGERYLIGSENLTWWAIHSLLADLAGVGHPRAELSTSMTYAASVIAELWARLDGTTPLSTRDEALTVGRYHWYSHDKLASLGYAPQSARSAIAAGLAWLLISPELPRWVRDGLRPLPEVRSSRPLIPRPL